VADHVDDSLEVELPGDAFLDAVDDRELGIALLGLLEEPRVLERDAQAAGERLEQAHVRVAERVLALEVRQMDRAAALIADQQRHHDEGFFGQRARQRDAPRSASTFPRPPR
jgi:hypothetical protein